ncbi:MAG: hypothetical protein COV44_02830 [Deltaproteobacteria bacterium CG11_big_fil_rev_8_21_14_0_20_45_16]|nr:MAG: hypothetical protein COV44_02830 [Deltaproteobacteria bacterium CG11_big_fil_rev_8_21_14_0_20_45_16]
MTFILVQPLHSCSDKKQGSREVVFFRKIKILGFGALIVAGDISLSFAREKACAEFEGLADVEAQSSVVRSEKTLEAASWEVYLIRFAKTVGAYRITSEIQKKIERKLSKTASESLHVGMQKKIQAYLNDLILEVETLAEKKFSNESRRKILEKGLSLVKGALDTRRISARKEAMQELYRLIVVELTSRSEAVSGESEDLYEELFGTIIPRRTKELSGLKKAWAGALATQVVESLPIQNTVFQFVFPHLEKIRKQLKVQGTSDLFEVSMLKLRRKIISLVDRHLCPEGEEVAASAGSRDFEREQILQNYMERASVLLNRRIVEDVSANGVAAPETREFQKQVERIVMYAMDRLQVGSLTLDLDFPGIAETRKQLRGDDLIFFNSFAYEFAKRMGSHADYYQSEGTLSHNEAVAYFDSKLPSVVMRAMRMEKAREGRWYSLEKEDEAELAKNQFERLVQEIFGMIRVLDNFPISKIVEIQRRLPPKGQRVFFRFYSGVLIAARRSYRMEMGTQRGWEAQQESALEGMLERLIELESIGGLDEYDKDPRSYTERPYANLLSYDFVPERSREEIPLEYHPLEEGLSADQVELVRRHFPLIERIVERRVYVLGENKKEREKLRVGAIAQVKSQLPNILETLIRKEESRISHDLSEQRGRLRLELLTGMGLSVVEIEKLPEFVKIKRGSLNPLEREFFDRSLGLWLDSILTSTRTQFDQAGLNEKRRYLEESGYQSFVEGYDAMLAQPDLNLHEGNLRIKVRNFVLDLEAGRNSGSETFEGQVMGRIESLIQDELEAVEIVAKSSTSNGNRTPDIFEPSSAFASLKVAHFDQYRKSVTQVDLPSKEEKLTAITALVRLENDMIEMLLESDGSLQSFVDELERRLGFGRARMGELVSIVPGNETEENISNLFEDVSRVVAELKSLLNTRKNTEDRSRGEINAKISSAFRSIAWRRLVARTFLSSRTDEEIARLPESLVISYMQTRNKIIEANLRLVLAPALQASRRKGSSFDGKVDRMDFVMKGNEGLILGIDTFEPTKGFQLSTHIVNCVVNKMKDKEGNLERRVIALPLTRRIDASRIQRYINTQYAESGLKPTNEEVSTALEIPVERVRDLLMVQSTPVSIDQPHGSNNNSDANSMSAYSLPDRRVVSSGRLEPEVLRLLRVGLEAIPKDRDFEIMRDIFGLSGREPMTLEAVGKENNLTRERVRQIKEKSLEVMKYAIYLDKKADELSFEDAEIIMMRWGLYDYKAPQANLSVIAETRGHDLQSLTEFLADVEKEAREFFPLD